MTVAHWTWGRDPLSPAAVAEASTSWLGQRVRAGRCPFTAAEVRCADWRTYAEHHHGADFAEPYWRELAADVYRALEAAALNEMNPEQWRKAAGVV